LRLLQPSAEHPRPRSCRKGYAALAINTLQAELPPPGTSLQFLAIKAIDGFRVDAALWQPNGKQPADTPLIVMALGDNNKHRRSDRMGGRHRGQR
jgi:hypothetical protein